MLKEYKLIIIKPRKGREPDLYEPPVLEGITLETERKGSPAKLTFTVVKTEALSFHEGDRVQFTYLNTSDSVAEAVGVDKKPDFVGFIFSKTRNKDHHIEVVAYDQMRFLKNKESYVMENIRADQVLKRIADDFKLTIGTLPNTGYVIEKLAKSNQTLIDIIQSALDETVTNTGRLFHLYDDAGYLTLSEVKEGSAEVFISEETARDFNYTTSIDSNTYNCIVVVDKEQKSGESRVVEQDRENQEKWGVLTNYVEANGVKNTREYARNMLKIHNRVSRSLDIVGQIGDIRVRAGKNVYLTLYLGDLNTKKDTETWEMMVEKATHAFNHGYHTMDLTLSGKEDFWYD